MAIILQNVHEMKFESFRSIFLARGPAIQFSGWVQAGLTTDKIYATPASLPDCHAVPYLVSVIVAPTQRPYLASEVALPNQYL